MQFVYIICLASTNLRGVPVDINLQNGMNKLCDAHLFDFVSLNILRACAKKRNPLGKVPTTIQELLDIPLPECFTHTQDEEAFLR